MNNNNNDNTRDPCQDPDSLGGPAFHPAAVSMNRLARQMPSMMINATQAGVTELDEENDFLFDGTEALSSSLYDELAVIDEKPDSSTLRARSRTH